MVLPSRGNVVNELTPPTVPVPLGELLADRRLALRQVAGPPAGPDTRVHAVHTSEMADPVPYLLGGELLLTAGVHCPDSGPGSGAGSGDDHWAGYVARTVQAGAAALGFGIAPLYDEVPPALAAECDRLGLPLLRVPRDTPFTAVARTLWQLVAERRHQALRRLSAAQQALTGAAGRPHPVPAVLAQLAEQVEGWTAVLGRDGRELAVAGVAPPARARSDLGTLAGRLRPGPSSAAGESGAWHLSAYVLTGAAAAGGDGGGLALGLCAPHRDGTDDAIARVAVVLLSLLTAHRTVSTDARPSAALVRRLLGAAPEDVTPLLNPTDRWTVVHGHRRGPAADGGPLAAAALAAGLDTSLVDLDGDTLRALVPGGRPVAEQRGWTLGVSRPVSAAELEQGGAEARRCLRRALTEGRAVLRQRPADTRDVTSLIAPAEARPLARARLGPLAGRPALTETLRAWLSVHGSWDRSAVALGIHRNTVRQRIARASELLEADLGDPDERAELWLALKWL